MSLMQPIGVFGGTFDPVHYGHLRTAFELRGALRLSEIRFVPAGNPPHRSAMVTEARLRLAMVAAATAGQEGFVVDDRELHRDGPSYSVDTLTALRRDLQGHPLCLILGMDAFLDLPTWYRWREILQLAHLVVAHRPGWRPPDTDVLGELLAEHATRRVDDLHEAMDGGIYIHAVTQLEISSTEIRELIAAGGDPQFLIPDNVARIIDESGCYAVRSDAT